MHRRVGSAVALFVPYLAAALTAAWLAMRLDWTLPLQPVMIGSALPAIAGTVGARGAWSPCWRIG
jgi:hypothetical protein